MKSLSFTCLLLIPVFIYSQLKVSGHIENISAGTKMQFEIPYQNWKTGKNVFPVQPDAKGNFSIDLPVKRAQIIFFSVDSEMIHLYGEPGKSIVITAKGKDLKTSLIFSGELGKENNLRRDLGLSFYYLNPHNWNDSTATPAKLLESLSHNQQAALKKVSVSPFRTSELFKKMTRADIDYSVVSGLWNLSWNNDIWSTPKTREQRVAWIKALTDAYATITISNDSAVDSYHYQQTISYYPYFLEIIHASREEFSKFISTSLNKSFDELSKEIKEKTKRYWKYIVYDRFLSGLAKESTLSSFLINGIYNGELPFQEEAYKRFRDSFPQSVYLPYIDEVMKPYLATLNKTEKEMAAYLFPSNADKFNTLDTILTAHKGKVVYIDMWGTWCSPCREEFAYNDALKKRFKDRPVDFLYIAMEHGTNPEKYWKQTILFYGLSGKHLIMNEELEKYFRNLYAGDGSFVFPSYILVDKNGKLVTIKAHRPSDKELLYQEIEKLL